MKRVMAWVLAATVVVGCVVAPSPSPPGPANSPVGTSASPGPTVAASQSTAPSPEATSPAPSSQQTTPATLGSAPPSSEPAGPQIVTFPTAPPATADWPTCTTFQLGMTGSGLGAGLGNVAAIVRLRNVSADGCALDGYPGVQLVGGTGVELPTVVRQAVDGAYMFPAVRAQRVALGPGDTASFEIGYSDNPFGGGENLPYDVACPAARWVRVILPGTRQFGTAELSVAPCEGVVDISPVFPGRNKLEFP